MGKLTVSFVATKNMLLCMLRINPRSSGPRSTDCCAKEFSLPP